MKHPLTPYFHNIKPLTLQEFRLATEGLCPKCRIPWARESGNIRELKCYQCGKCRMVFADRIEPGPSK